jgi:hypothetical protein
LSQLSDVDKNPDPINLQRQAMRDQMAGPGWRELSVPRDKVELDFESRAVSPAGLPAGWEVTSVCDEPGQPSTVTEALSMLDRALDHLNTADAASLPAGVQAEALRALERAEAKHTAARARVLAAFAGQAAYEGDGHGSAGAWLRWQTRVTTGAAAGAVGWARRLAAHPVIAGAMATGALSESWARKICAWTERLPAGKQDDADEILAAAARAGVDLADLAGLAQEMYERSHQDRDGEDGFADRAVWLDTTLAGAGRLTGDLTGGVRGGFGGGAGVVKQAGRARRRPHRRAAPS